VPHEGVGHRLADLCARLATWLHVPAKEGETGRAPRSARQRVAPHRPLLLGQWVRGGVSYKDRTTHPKFKAKLAVRHFYLVPVRHNLLFRSCAPLCVGLGYSDSELGKLITCWCVSLQPVTQPPVVELRMEVVMMWLRGQRAQ
jgi:hypothetical protein